MGSVTFSLDERLREVGLTDADLVAVTEVVESDEAARSAFLELAKTGPHAARELTRNPDWLEPIAAGAASSRSSHW